MTTFVRRRSTRRLLAPLLAMGSVACASAGATLDSGVGDAFPVHPPYYAGAARTAVALDSSRIGYLPVEFQRGVSQRATLDPRSGPGTPTAALLSEMSTYLDTLLRENAAFVRLPASDARTAVPAMIPPDVSFGCITVSGASDDECEVRGDGGALGRGHPPQKLTVGRPSTAWAARMGESLAGADAGRALIISLEVGQLLLRQAGLRGNKELELGTGHTERLPWLTSLETPVAVLQLTGALIDRNGRAIRIGAEGFQAKRTPFVVSSAGAQALFSDDDVTDARTRRRDDLPGKPLAWRVALHHLVSELTGRELPVP